MAGIGRDDTASLWSDGSSVVVSQTPIEPDSGDDDSIEISSTRSLRNSLVGYIRENGRLYTTYGGGDYFLPSDQPEAERLALQYFILQALFEHKVHFAPLNGSPKRVLDIGTGTGHWCLDMAKKYPRAHITGTELTPDHLPPEGQYPENIHWVVDDANNANWGKRWDYIHTRMMLGSFENFETIIKRSFDHLEPGGWMESQELWPRLQCDDGTLDKATNMFDEWTGRQDEAAMRLQRPLRIANKLKRWYERNGFVDVREEVFKIPINGWAKDPRLKMLGKWWGRSLLDGIQGFSMALFTRVFAWSSLEVEVYLVKVREAMQDRSCHAYHSIHTVYGRKPTVEEQKQIDARKARKAAETPPNMEAVLNSTDWAHHPAERPATGRPATAQTNNMNGAHHIPKQPERTSQSSNRRPRQPFSSSPHPNA